MSKPLLTVGMAVYNDFNGVYFTLQALRLGNDMKDIEIVVVDNKPDSSSSKHVKNFIGNCNRGSAGARYIPMEAPVGTTAPRNRVFAEAEGYAVVCLDSHVLTQPGALNRLTAYYEDTGSNDILSGPLVYDQLDLVSTHINNEWRGGMWGTWGMTWRCVCHRKLHAAHEELQPLLFSVTQSKDPNPLCEWKSLPANALVKECSRCGHGLPESIQFNGHEQRLLDLGYQMYGSHPDDEPFEVPGQGLGLFSSRKEAWLGFNEGFRGFGGEEMYIHEKYRKAGRRAMCLPFLRWVHRFYRPEGVEYPLQQRDMIRNCILGKLELGHSLLPVYNYFVVNHGFPQTEWDGILSEVV